MPTRTSVIRLLAAIGGTLVVAADGPAPSRIVSLAPSVTEALFEIGLGHRIAGVTSYCRYPAAARALPTVGGYLTPSYEAVARLRPDLAVVLREHADVERHLTALRVPILRLDHGSLEGVIDSLHTLGERCGAVAGAAAAANDLRRHLARASEIAGAGTHPRVLLAVGRTEDVAMLHAAAPGTIHHDMIVAAGGRNVLASGRASYPTLSAEGIMRLDPDVIVEFAPDAADATVLRRQWDALRSLRAVKTGRVHVFGGAFLSVPGPRLVRFTETLARIVHEPGNAAEAR